MLMAGHFGQLCAITFICFIRTATPNACQHGLPSGEGDLKIVAVLGLRNAHGGRCQGVSTAGYQAAIALDWVTRLLNGNGTNDSYIPGIRIGRYRCLLICLK